jgi:hypothetical protein
MKLGMAVIASVALCGEAIAGPAQYTVDGIGVGTQLNFDSASYREYRCTPSEQFDGFTWCQKSRSDKDKRGAYGAGYSLLHSQAGNIAYVNRSQEPAFLRSNEAEQEVQRYASRIGEAPRIMKMPHRRGLPDGLIATWGKVTLVQLDQQSVQILSQGKSPKKGLLIDWLGNFARSAKEGLPIYRIEGGPGFVWAASFDQKGRGFLRTAAVDTSLLSSAPAQPQPSPQAGNSEAQSTALAPSQTAAAAPTQLPSAITPIAEPAQEKAAAEVAKSELAKPLVDGEDVKTPSEQPAAVEEARSQAAMAPLNANTATPGTTAHRWEDALYGAIGGLVVALSISGIGFLLSRRRSKVASTPIPEESPTSAAEVQLLIAASPAVAVAEEVFGRELEEQVAAINATEVETAEQQSAVETNASPDDQSKEAEKAACAA